MSKLYKVNVYQEIDSLEYTKNHKKDILQPSLEYPKYKEGEEQIYYGEEE